MRILIAEDDPRLRQGIRDLLAIEGYDCIAVADGQAALEAVRAEKPDFCIFDVVMPGLDGVELCRLLHRQGNAPPILLLTACGQEIDRVVGLESGADDYLTKPFSTRELVARIRAICRRSGLRAPPTVIGDGRGEGERFRMGDLDIDPRGLRAYRDGRVIDLARREMTLLAALYERAGAAVSRDELFDLCWGRDYMPNSRALDQYVSSLRQKIERDPSSPMIIRTVRGIGYRYDPET